MAKKERVTFSKVLDNCELIVKKGNDKQTFCFIEAVGEAYHDLTVLGKTALLHGLGQKGADAGAVSDSKGLSPETKHAMKLKELSRLSKPNAAWNEHRESHPVWVKLFLDLAKAANPDVDREKAIAKAYELGEDTVLAMFKVDD